MNSPISRHEILTAPLALAGCANASRTSAEPHLRAHNVWFTPTARSTNEVVDPTKRMNALAACEAELLEQMPVVPLVHHTWAYLEALYVRALKATPSGSFCFKYASIDTNWRSS